MFAFVAFVIISIPFFVSRRVCIFLVVVILLEIFPSEIEFLFFKLPILLLKIALLVSGIALFLSKIALFISKTVLDPACMSLPSANTPRILIDKYRSPIVLTIIVNSNPSDPALAASEYLSPVVAAVPVTTQKESVGLTTHIKFEGPISGRK
ncbi:hypothetical protein PCANC_17918, partial [Puccinia coronata f. sp. avenae]